MIMMSGSVGRFGVIEHVDPWLDLFFVWIGLLELIAYLFEEAFVDVKENVVVWWLLL